MLARAVRCIESFAMLAGWCPPLSFLLTSGLSNWLCAQEYSKYIWSRLSRACCEQSENGMQTKYPQ